MRLARTLFAATCLGTVAFAQTYSASNGGTQLNWQPFMDGQQSANTRQGIQVLDSESAFRTYWQKTLRKDPMAAPKNVNWSREKLVAINLGQRKSGGFRIHITRMVKGTDGIVRVTATEWTPTPGAYVTDALTSPWVIVKVDRMSERFALDVQTRTSPPGMPFVEGSNSFPNQGNNNGGGRCNCRNCSCGCGCGG